MYDYEWEGCCGHPEPAEPQTVYDCPFCGCGVQEGETLYLPDGINAVCADCFKEYISDLSPEEFCEMFGVLTKFAERECDG